MLRKKRSDSLGPAHTRGLISPGGLPGLVGYWDARDLTTGAITAWSPRASDGLIGNATGTGTSVGSGADARCTYPRLATANTVSVSAVDSADPIGMWMIASVYTIGSSGSYPRSMMRIADNATGADSGFFWFNHLTTLMKPCSTSYVDFAGLTNPPLVTKCLYMFNKISSTSVVLHRYAESGSATTVAAVDWGAASRLYIGRDYADNATWRMDGEIYAFGLYTQNFDAASLSALRQWSSETFGVTA